MELSRLKIGMSDGRVAYIKDRYTNTLVLGKPGEGKTSWLSQCFESDGNRVCRIVLDPTGFLTETMYAMSKGQALYFSLKTDVSINPMNPENNYDPNAVVENICEALNQVIVLTTPNEKLTVKMRGIMDVAIKYCLANGRPNLLNVRDKIINTPGSSETKDGVLQRLNFLLNDERMVRLLCGNNSVRWGELIAQGKSFLLDGFGMGNEKLIFAGTLITHALKTYFRQERPKEYRPCALYVDEAHLFTNPNFMDILKEGRKYKIAAVLATQDLALFSDQMTRILCNSGNIICFRVGSREAHLIGREMNIEPTNLQFLERWHAAFLTRDGQGIAKISRPPLVRKMEVKAEVKTKSKGWFVLESCQPESTQ